MFYDVEITVTGWNQMEAMIKGYSRGLITEDELDMAMDFYNELGSC